MLRVLKLSHNSSSLRPQVPHDIKVHQCPPPSRIRVCPRNPTRHHNSQAARSWLQWSVSDSSWNSGCSTSSHTNKYIGGRNWTLPKHTHILIQSNRYIQTAFPILLNYNMGERWKSLNVFYFLLCLFFCGK